MVRTPSRVHVGLLVAVLTAVALAGCSAPGSPNVETAPGELVGNTRTNTSRPPGSNGSGPTASTGATSVGLSGVVQDPTLRPIEGATVAGIDLGRTVTTDRLGRFDFGSVTRQSHLLKATATGFANATMVATPRDGQDGIAVTFTLERLVDTAPRHTTTSHRGIIQCGLELLLVSGPCDSTAAYFNDRAEQSTGARPAPQPFPGNDTLNVPLEPGWTSVVVDVDFSPNEQKTIDGLRLVARGPNYQDNTGIYQKYHTVNGSAPFTMRLDAGLDYGGDVPMPANSTTLQLQVYPHSYGYHNVCTGPVYDECFLGAGGGLDIRFTLYITVFYYETAPGGWTLLTTR